MVYSYWGWGVAHHVEEGASLLLFLTIGLGHRVALHLVLLQWTLTAFDNILFHVGETSVQTLPCVVLEVIVGHHRLSLLRNLYVFMS